MEAIFLSDSDRMILLEHTRALNRLADMLEERRSCVVYSNKEAAGMLGRDEHTISRWVASGRIKKCVNDAGKIGIPQTEIERELKRKRREA